MHLSEKLEIQQHHYSEIQKLNMKLAAENDALKLELEHVKTA